MEAELIVHQSVGRGTRLSFIALTVGTASFSWSLLIGRFLTF